MSFDSPKDLIKWGRDGTNELDAACRQFFDDGALKGFTEIDPQTGEKLRKVRQVKPIPSKITRLANEAINNIRHSFDQALFSAASLIGKPMKQAYFPWASNPTDLDRLLASANRGIPAELHEVLRRLEPYERGGAYPGGDDTVRALAKIAGVRKHTIALRVGAQPSAVVIHELTADGPFSIPSFQWEKQTMR